MKQFVLLFILFLAPALPATEVDRLLNEYQRIKTVTCQIRRTVSGNAGNIQFISRVYWQNDDRLHVDNLTPLPRRIIADGTRFYSYAKGDPKGFSRPVNELSNEMLVSLRKIPGTAMDHLLRLKGAVEQVLEPAEEGMRQTAYNTENNYVILKFDKLSRLVAIDFFKTPDMTVKTASYRYSDFQEVGTGAWIPLHHEASLTLEDKNTVSETVQIDRFIANQPIAVSLFNPEAFFDKGIDFVDSFERIYVEQ